MEKCALIEERLLAPPISPAHFSQLALPIMASGEDEILVYESIVRGHHVYKDLDTNDRRDVFQNLIHSREGQKPRGSSSHRQIGSRSR